MPGVELGEIGPKLNDTSNNIGYCRFTRLRVPLAHMFSKFSSVEADGTYVAAPRKLSKFKYIRCARKTLCVVERWSVEFALRIITAIFLSLPRSPPGRPPVSPLPSQV